MKGVHTVRESDSDDQTTTYGSKRTDSNKLDALLAMSIPQKVGTKTEHNAKLETNSVWGMRNQRLSYSYHKEAKKTQK